MYMIDHFDLFVVTDFIKFYNCRGLLNVQADKIPEENKHQKNF